jgi:peptidoglycan/LPS O-acetylase OafA/YrhL
MPVARYLDARVPAWIRALLGTLALGAALYALLLVGAARAVGVPLDPRSWWPLGALALIAALVWLAARTRRRREEQRLLAA